jgi:tRNA pseudouridine55 synthase
MIFYKDFIVVIDKPKGRTSFWVVDKIKKITSTKKVGHTGTLDPLATGVLPICVGEATKISDFMMQGNKVYTTKIKLGERTDTLDAEGAVTQRGERDPLTIDKQELFNTFNRFSGNIIQIPPMYSAIKKDGVPLYKLARKGENVEREGRAVNVEKIELLEFDPPYVEIRVYCSKGTYIRTLVDDIGELLGTLAHVVELRRTSSGIFDVSDAVTLDDSTDLRSLQTKAFSIEDVIQRIIPVIKVPRSLAIRVANGLQLSYFDLMTAAGSSKDWTKSPNVALFSEPIDGGGQKLLAVLKIVPQDFEDLINMSPSSKITQTLRIFRYDEWMVQDRCSIK